MVISFYTVPIIKPGPFFGGEIFDIPVFTSLAELDFVYNITEIHVFLIYHHISKLIITYSYPIGSKILNLSRRIYKVKDGDNEYNLPCVFTV